MDCFNVVSRAVVKLLNLSNAFVFYDVKRYDIRGKKYLESLDKFYLCDTGIRYAVLGSRNMDYPYALTEISGNCNNDQNSEMRRNEWNLSSGMYI